MACCAFGDLVVAVGSELRAADDQIGVCFCSSKAYCDYLDVQADVDANGGNSEFQESYAAALTANDAGMFFLNLARAPLI